MSKPMDVDHLQPRLNRFNSTLETVQEGDQERENLTGNKRKPDGTIIINEEYKTGKAKVKGGKKSKRRRNKTRKSRKNRRKSKRRSRR